MRDPLLFAYLLLSLLNGCSFAPAYQRPQMPIPLHYKETAEWKQAKPLQVTTKDSPWWHMYEDPVLNELEEKVTCANQNLKIALARYQEARAILQVQRSSYYPSVFAISNSNREKMSENVANLNFTTLQTGKVRNFKTTFNDYLIGSFASYEVDLWGRVRNAVQASKSNAQASAADVIGVSLSLHTELALNYFRLRGDEAAQRVLDATVIAYQKALYLIRKRYEGGASPIGEVDQAVTQLENAKTMAINMRLQRAQIEHAIAVLVGEIPANFTLSPMRAPIKAVVVAPDLPSNLLQRRPDISAAALRVQAANAQIGVACAAFFPQINLTSIVGFESEHLSKLISKPSLFWSLGPINALSLIQPMAKLVLFDGGRLRGLLKATKATYYKTVASYRQTVLKAFQEVENSLVAIHRLEEEDRSQTAATAAAKRALDQARKRFVGGITNYLEVIVSENLALQAELAFVDIHTQRQLASVQLIKALGGGWSCMRPQCL